MATLLIDNSNSPTKMRVRITYTAGNGNITITQVETCRTDAYTTQSYGHNGHINIWINGINHQQTNRNVYFKANSVYTTAWTGSVSVDGLSGNTAVGITFDGTNTANINNSNFSGTIDAGYSTPTLSISGAGSSASNRAILTGSGATITVVIGNGGGRNIALYYNNIYFDTYYVATSVTKTITLPLSPSDTPENDKPAMGLAVTVDGLSDVAILHLIMDDSIKPTMNTVSISGSVSAYSQLNNKFVKGLTRPIISVAATKSYGSDITSYSLTGITGYGASLFPKVFGNGTSSTYTASNPFQTSGNVNATAYCTDKRGRTSSSKTSSNISVIDYVSPSVVPSIQRCKQDGTLDEEGTYCKLSIRYNVSPINDGHSDLNTLTMAYSLDGGNTWVNVPKNGWNNTVTAVFNNNGQPFAINQTYSIQVKYNEITTSNEQELKLTPSYTLISKHAGGKGLSIGRIADEDNLHVYMEAHLHNGLYIGDTLVLYDDGN